MNHRASLLFALLLSAGAVSAAPQKIACNYQHASDVAMNATWRKLGLPPTGGEDVLQVDEVHRTLSLLRGAQFEAMSTVTWTPEVIHGEFFYSAVQDAIVHLKRFRHFKLDRFKGTISIWFDYRTESGTALTSKQARTFVRKSGQGLFDTYEELRAQGTCKPVKQQF